MNGFLKSGYVLVLFAIFGIIVSAGGAVAAVATPQLGWQYTSGNGAVYGLGISAEGDSLIALIGFGFAPGGQIVSLDPATGAARWLVETEEAPSADPVVVDGVVYAGIGSLVGGGAAVYALDAGTGDVLWRTDVERSDLPATPIDAVTLASGTLFVNRGDATLLALDAATGMIEWEIELQKPTRGAPAVSGDRVFVATGFDGAIILAFDIDTGEALWSVEDPANPVTGPVLSGGLLYIPFVSGEMVAFDPLTGEERWRAYAGELDEEVGIDPYPGLPLVVEGTLYLSSNGFAGAYTVALDAATGAERWSARTGDFSAGAPSLLESELLVGSDTGDLLALDPVTGSELWRIAIPDAIDNDLNQSSPPLTAGERIFVRERAGGVVAVSVTR